jgi:3-deoxy-D-manno-octulosonate 8-phosphate phosphatase (KDO 8-P phosphatase)
MVNIKDGYALQLAVKKGLKIAIITGANSPAIVKRFNGLGISDVFTKVSEKLPLLRQWISDNKLSANEVAFVGDDIPDIQCMKTVGLAIAPVDAAIDVKAIAHYISPVQGGYGVGRDVLEEILKAKGLWMSSADAFGW